MTDEQKAQALRSIAVARKRLQELEAKKNPQAPDLKTRRQHADWQLGWLLEKLKDTLPQEVKAEVQTCLDITERLWNEHYQPEPEQKETSPSCLAASDSF